ncbi:MAG: aromatic amino acid lyase, partial [Luteibaculum sp.]
MSNTFVIHPSPYSIDAIVQGLDLPLSLSAESRQAIIKGRDFLEKKIAEADAPIYGINTGFGSLCNTPIGPDMLAQLQVNLVKSHACGVGQAIDKRISKLIFLLKIIGLSNFLVQKRNIHLSVSITSKIVIPKQLQRRIVQVSRY